MFCGEIRYQPWTTSVPQVPSVASCSLVVLLRSEISTLARSSSSLAVPLKVSWPPGATVYAGDAVGGVIGAGVLIATVGATPVVVISQSRVALRRSDWPVLSIAVADMRHSPSCGRVTSYCQVAEVAPTTSGRPLKVLKLAATLPSSWRYWLLASRNQKLSASTPWSSPAVPVAMKVVLVSTLLLGPEIEVVGVWSWRPKVSNFFVALVGSLVPVTAKVFAITCSSRLPVSVRGRDQAVEVASWVAR